MPRHGFPDPIDLGGQTYRLLREEDTALVLTDHEGATYVLPLGVSRPDPLKADPILDPTKLRRLR